MHHALTVNATWLPSSPSIIKLNVDRSCNEYTRHSGCGGLFRDSSGIWIIQVMFLMQISL